MSFAVGSLVKARGREWVVLPESEDDFLILRPLGGGDEEIAGIATALESVESAVFDLPNPEHVGDHRSCRLLRDAIRLSSRAGAGPFRSFARIAVEPRPYQLVPLLMGLKLDPVRLLIADDVGIGKTVEACLVARELLDRGEIQRIAVVCPPHLAEQWQLELSSKFHIDAELVLAGTAARLERGLQVNESLFDRYPHVVVSVDFIKSDRRRDEFARTCPEFVIVDEAHTCASGYEGRGARHQRHALVQQLARTGDRHIVLVTATPHSGNEETFRSLLALMDPSFADLPVDLTGAAAAPHRRRLAKHFVQRRRGDIKSYLGAETAFPDREELEETYTLHPEYRQLFDKVVAFARESVLDKSGEQYRQRVRWWSALALLRSLASSPAAAAATLRNRAAVADAETEAEADEIGRRTVLDLDADEPVEGIDVTPGGDSEGDEVGESKTRARLRKLAKEADKLRGAKDVKLQVATNLLKQLVSDGFQPIVFCRFIATAEYLAEQMSGKLGRGVEVASVTGHLTPVEREARVAELGEKPKRVLICTDCLSEGVNLQEHFDAVVHYDLSWNPTRHEQRAGRVDRYGQPRATVRVLTYWGTDTQIDGIVLDVLLRKHKSIRSSLGISVPVPADTNAVIEAVFEGLLLREKTGSEQQLLPGLEQYLKPTKDKLHSEWDAVADREKKSRTVFAQETIKVDEVAREVTEARMSTGGAADVRAFATEAIRLAGGVVGEDGRYVRFGIASLPRALRDLVDLPEEFEAAFELPVKDGALHLARTHPAIEGLAGHVIDSALDPILEAVATRCGAIRTRAISTRTTLLLVRYRFDLTSRRGRQVHTQIADEVRLLGFRGPPTSAKWLEQEVVEALLAATPDENTMPEQARDRVRQVVEHFPALMPHIEEQAHARAAALVDAHRRVRESARVTGLAYEVDSRLPADILGVYVYLPVRTGP